MIKNKLNKMSSGEEKVVTFMDKVKILPFLMSGMNPEAIAGIYSTTVTKINEISEKHGEIMDVYEYFLKSQHEPLKNGLHPRMESILFTWFTEQSKVSNKALGDKAKYIMDILNEPPTSRNTVKFTGSNNWANAFRTRYGIEVSRRKSASKTNHQELSSTVAESSNTATTEPVNLLNVPEEDSEEDDAAAANKQAPLQIKYIYSKYNSEQQIKIELEELQTQVNDWWSESKKRKRREKINISFHRTLYLKSIWMIRRMRMLQMLTHREK